MLLILYRLSKKKHIYMSSISLSLYIVYSFFPFLLKHYNFYLFIQVAQDETGQSKGYGFVHFEMEQSATQSIEKVNGMLLNGKKVFVGRFVGRKDREKELGQKAKLYTNVYIKNIDENVNDKELYEMFSQYGTITSFKVCFIIPIFLPFILD